MFRNKTMSGYLACMLVVLSMLTAVFSSLPAQAAEGNAEADAGSIRRPKYIFLFIGDGMSYPQFQAASDYLGVLEDKDYLWAQPSRGEYHGTQLDGPEYLNFMRFETAGSAVNFDSNSFAPDSASSATSIATGNKTYAGSINVDTSGTVSFETIAEKAHRQHGLRVGIITSVYLNHATPAAFYGHNVSRDNYYELGLELPASGFEFFAGRPFLNPEGYEGEEPRESLYDITQAAGYKICISDEEIASISQEDEKIVVVAENMGYEIDRKEGERSLADYVRIGIDFLDNEQGFFMMCEGGAIDWACHANDAATAVHETCALADAVQVAVDFAELHPDETLIIVTGDHETGGLSIGFAGTDYDTYLTLLESQTISFEQFDLLVEGYRENQTPFKEVLKEIEDYFGLKRYGTNDDLLALTDYELALLETAYRKSVEEAETGMDEQEEYILYGTYEPLSVTITHILNNKAGLSFSSYAHSGLPVAVFAQGVCSEMFGGYYDNTEIFHKLALIMNVE